MQPSPRPTLAITIAQLNPTIGDLTGNLQAMRAAARKAHAQGSALVVFPELVLTAYYPADLLDEEAFQERLETALQELADATRDTPALVWVVGAPTRRALPGKKFHNSLLILKNGEPQAPAYHKQLLPTYGVFDERRHFEPGPDAVRIVTIDGVRLGFLICEDGWNDEGRDYALNPFARLAEMSPDLIISINASPSHVGKRAERHALFGRACRRHQLPLLYVNQVGGHDSLVYDGGSFAVSAEGVVQLEAPRFTEAVSQVNFDPTRQEFFSPTLTPPGDEDPREFYREQILLGLRDYARRCGFTRAVVGSSGGIDSAVTLALAAEALGPENVIAITMPSEYSSAGSVEDSVTLCQNLGVTLLTHPIKALVEAYRAEFERATGQQLTGLALENVQARIRGTILMEYSNQFGHLLLTTGNKSEISVGYCTLYGDTNGGLGLIADAYKTEVFPLAEHLNARAGRCLIPRSIIEKPPSAELAPGQKDSDSLPDYPILDEILKLEIEGHCLSADERTRSQAVVSALNQTPAGSATIERIRRLIARNEYKRRQAPPNVRLRARAFGSGRQLPIAAHYL